MAKIRASNILRMNGHVTREERLKLLNQSGCTVWLTGLPSSGKSTTAFGLEYALVQQGHLAYVLDGDNVRDALNQNLGFSKEDRQENIRRIGEVAKLFSDAGIITITSFISPYRKDRDQARVVHQAADLGFVEVFIDAPVEVCEARDPKGLYRRARAGDLKGFTGVDDPYESPLKPELTIKTAEVGPQEATEMVLKLLEQRGRLKFTDRHLADVVRVEKWNRKSESSI
jgi:adenylylsulfate kinase